MRITNNMLISNMTYNLQGNLQRLEKLQYEMAMGKKFRVPSEDPIGASKSLKFNIDISKVDQYIRNSKDANSWMKESESALKEINAVLQRANELTVQAANSTNSGELDKIQEEIKELKGHVIQVANSTYAGRSLFTGYKTDDKLLDDQGNYLVDLKEYTVVEDGVSKDKKEIFVYNVGVSETVSVNILGNKIFGSGNKDYESEVEKGDKAYLIDIFNKLETALEEKDADGIQESLTNIKDAMSNILSVIAEIGAKTNRLELTQGKLEDQLINLKELLSYNEDVSLPDTYMKLNIEENIYRASLAVGGRIIQPSLMDFLR